MKSCLRRLFAPLLVVLLGAAPAGQTQNPQPPVPPTSPPATAGAAPAAPAPRINPAPAANNASDYRLVTGDKLRIEVYKDPQLSQTLQVRPDGKITLPLIGDVMAAGRTSLELRDTVSTALNDYVKNPVVTVIVIETMPQTIYVMGEVNAPGPQTIKGEISILQALAAAGGFKDFAKKKSIKILRPGPSGTTTLEFNYNDAVKGEAKVVNLRAGDTVIVP